MTTVTCKLKDKIDEWLITLIVEADLRLYMKKSELLREGVFLTASFNAFI